MITRDELKRTLIAANHEWPGNLERVIDAVMVAIESHGHAKEVDTTVGRVTNGGDSLHVVAEEPEWEYGWVSRYPSGDQASESDSGNTREFAERAVKMNREYWPGQQNAPLEYTLSQRTKTVPAGPWVPVKQEGADDV